MSTVSVVIGGSTTIIDLPDVPSEAGYSSAAILNDALDVCPPEIIAQSVLPRIDLKSALRKLVRTHGMEGVLDAVESIASSQGEAWLSIIDADKALANKVTAIKALREIAGCGLKEAKTMVDLAFERGTTRAMDIFDSVSTDEAANLAELGFALDT